MRALIVFESMYGNTHVTAGRIADGLLAFGDVRVVPVGEATTDLVAAADLVVVGGPTHMHGMSSSRSRSLALNAAMKEDSDLTVDPDAEGPGLRDWFEGLGGATDTRAAAFDTRVDGPVAITGRASRGIARRLRHHHFKLVAEPESFLVDKESHLLKDEAQRAHEWGFSLGKAIQAAPSKHQPLGAVT